MLYLLLLSAAVSAELPLYRLPGDIIPHRYNLSLLTDLDRFIFNGHVDIEIECKIPTDTIKLHAVSLKIPNEEISLKLLGNKTGIELRSCHLDTDNQFFVIKVKEKLVSGTVYLLHISFQGELTEGLAGYYRTSYVDKTTNTTKWLAVTQFEAIHARRAFPCFDEPAMKAHFIIRLGYKEGLKSVSNMPVHTTNTINGWIWQEYKESVLMSTYLVAFMVSDFEFKASDPEPNNVLFRIWARKEALSQTEFTRKYGPKFLNYFEDFFCIPYPLPKQDMVAIPDFSSGAMENWGLITYREGYLLLDDNTTSVELKNQIADTVAHELAHQWFGNLVTMRWWTDLWLNEGFATYVSSLAVHHEFPEWNSFDFAVSEYLTSVFSLDSLESSHPVSVPIKHPDEIEQIFDIISYNKGALLLHMMNSFLGNEVFQSGTSAYLKKFSYSNAEQDELWEALTEAAKKKQVLPHNRTVKEVMDTWTLQTGYPVVMVQRDVGKITLTQKRFLDIKPKSQDNMNGCWWIPLAYSTAKNIKFNDTRPSHWLNCTHLELSFDTGAGPDDWIVINNKAAGIFRVNYDTVTWGQLADVLQSPNMSIIHELNRLQMVLDAMALARVGDLPYTQALRILKYVQHESACLPWSGATAALRELKYLLWRTDKYDQFSTFVQVLFNNIYQRFSNLTLTPDGLEEARHQQLVVSMACNFKVGDCVQKAVQLFKDWMTSEMNPIPKDLRDTVYCEGLKQGGEEDWQYVLRKYQASNIANEKSSFLSALTCTNQEDLLRRCLEWSVNGTSPVRRQDSSQVFHGVAANSKPGYKLAWSFLKDNIRKLHDYLAPNTQDLGSYVSTIANRMVFKQEIDEMKKFVVDNKKLLEKAQLEVNQAIEFAEVNLEWMRNFYANISEALVI